MLIYTSRIPHTTNLIAFLLLNNFKVTSRMDACPGRSLQHLIPSTVPLHCICTCFVAAITFPILVTNPCFISLLDHDFDQAAAAGGGVASRSAGLAAAREVIERGTYLRCSAWPWSSAREYSDERRPSCSNGGGSVGSVSSDSGDAVT